jgi:hypothetical protein
MEYFNRDQAFPARGVFSGLPVQAIPTKRKTKEWFKATMDSLELIGLKQLDENQKFKDFYRMMEGKLSFMELKDVIPYLKDVQSIRDNVNIPSFLRHYDIIGTIVNAFVGWLGNLSDKYNVVGLDESEVNQYSATKENLLYNYIREELDRRVRQELLNRGLDPDYNNFASEEEKQAYAQQIQEVKASMTPPEIENFMNTKWKTAEVIWGSHTLEADRGRFYMDEIDTENFIDYLLTGRCFRNYHVGYDYYKPERWSPLNTFYSKTLDSKYPQYGDYIGRVHYYTANDIIVRWGHLLTAKDKQKLIGGADNFNGTYNNGDNGSYVSLSKSASVGMLYQNKVIPWKGYNDYASIKAYEDYYGIPAGTYTGYDSNGNEYHRTRFMPNLEHGNYYNRAQSLSDEHVRSDLYQVTESYWVSPAQVYVITYQTETGLVTTEMVTDELLQDFLQENGIKKITRTMSKGMENPEINTYFVDYVPQVRYGVKISGGALAQDNLYLDGEPIDHQIKGDSNIYDFVLPVAGYIGTSMANRIQPYQIFYNFSINQINNILEKEIGKFFLGDINLVPSEYKDLGEDVADIWANLLDVAKSVGALTLDTSSQNTKGGVPFNQFAVYDLSQTEQLKTRMELAEWSRMKCFEMVGITPQVINGPNRYETATGVQQGVTASMLQTQIYFDNFGYFKKRALDLHLAVAQQCQQEGKDISVMYTKSDLTRAFLSIGTDGLSLRHLGVQALSNSKKRDELEKFKTFMLQLNTAGGDIYDLASIFTSDSMVELIQNARNTRAYNERQIQQQQQNQMQLNQQQIQAEAAEKDKQRQHELALEDKKGQYRILQEKIQAAGRAADAKSDATSLNFLASVSDQTVRQADIESKERIEDKKIENDSKLHDDEMRMKMEELKLKSKELAQRAREDATKRYVAGINKN